MSAEQLVNLYQDTVGVAGYIAGSGVLNVTSGSGAPSSGPFTVTILNSTGTAILLLFRVASLVSTVFTGVAEGPDVNAPAGSIIIGSTLSVAAITNLLSAVGGGFIQPLTPPVSASFSQLNFNVGTSVVTIQTTGSDFITIQQADPGHTGNTAAIQKAKLAATFTLTIGISMMSRTNVGCIQGLWLGDGSTSGLIFGTYNQSDLIIRTMTSLTNSGGTGGNLLAETFQQAGIGPLLWLQIQETVSARNYSISCDGVTFYQVYTESNTANFTTADYGIGLYMFNNGGSGQVALYSFKETNP